MLYTVCKFDAFTVSNALCLDGFVAGFCVNVIVRDTLNSQDEFTNDMSFNVLM